jgi:hypothetical protein
MAGILSTSIPKSLLQPGKVEAIKANCFGPAATKSWTNNFCVSPPPWDSAIARHYLIAANRKIVKALMQSYVDAEISECIRNELFRVFCAKRAQ